jgi:F1F0 ATPase subunit 2
MDDARRLLLAVLAGLALGAFYCGGLWWTVRRGLIASQPILWFFGSMAIRSSLVVAGIYFASGGRWDRILACLLGFTLARGVAVRLARWTGAGTVPGEEAGHAPQSR